MFTAVMTFAGKKTIVEPFWKPPKISPVCIQYDTIDANLELSLYLKVLCLSIIFIFIYLFTEAIALK
jgi:hypothetical protein